MGQITTDEVIAYLGMPAPEPGSPDAMHLSASVAGVNEMVPRTVPRVRRSPAADPWPKDVQLAAVMQGGRLFQRRASPSGVTSYSDTGATFIPRFDPDIERLFGIGKWAPPAAT